MRRELRSALPALAYHFGLKPADVEDLTYGEVEVFIEALEQIQRDRD